METSTLVEKSKKIIDEVKGSTLSVEERREKAIELAAFILREARRIQTNQEYRMQAQIDKMLDDPEGIAFFSALTDKCFRSKNCKRVADQLLYILHQYGIPKFLSIFRKLGFFSVKFLASALPEIVVHITKRLLRRETTSVIIPAENRLLARHLEKRKKEGFKSNLNHLGEAILGEEEAEKRLKLYLDDLARPDVECISVKISTICSQLNLLAWEDTLKILEERLRKLYRVAAEHTFVRMGGKCVPKFVNLDMEQYSDLKLTTELFRRVLGDPEFYQHCAGIVLQAYLPDSYLIQQELTVWAMQRVAKGGAPIKLRIVKGANLAMEKVEASIKGWPQATYKVKADVDANFKRMVEYALKPEHASSVHIGIGSHNLFDIAYALILQSENGVDDFVEIEMLEGMADHVGRSLQELDEKILLYCPAASEKEFHTAIAYLFRRLDENSEPENFLRHIFSLLPNTKEWQHQANHFSLSCHSQKAVSISPRRCQNRFNKIEIQDQDVDLPFKNEPDTDWSLDQNRKWLEQTIIKFKTYKFEDVPLVIGGKEYRNEENFGIGRDPSNPDIELYRYSLANSDHIEKALKISNRAWEKWSSTSVKMRSRLLANVSHELRCKRGKLLGYMMADAGKTAQEADVEISEAIDFIEYYRRRMETFAGFEDISLNAKGTCVVASPWNFPCSIPIGGIVSSLISGNSVIFKPSRDTAFIGWQISKLFWEAGVSPEILQFVLCDSENIGSELIKDERVSTVILTGSTNTAKKMLELRPDLHLIAETGGKNALIVTAMSDRDSAIKDLIQSAFGFSGQKCSACSLAILEKEVYDDLHFRRHLKDAVKSLKVGSAWDFSTNVNPLIHEPSDTLLKGLTQLDEGEQWLLEPKQDEKNRNLWSPGIKLGVKEGSFSHKEEFFGPILSVMRADNLKHALQLANNTKYGLTSGIHSLDEREQEYWLENIEAGNYYINRGITGAIVERQPFGGVKESNFGPGQKTGGPNYITQLLDIDQVALPSRKKTVTGTICILGLHLEKLKPKKEETELWNASVESYTYSYQNYFSKNHDPSLNIGQDNIFKYVPMKKIILCTLKDDKLLDILRVIAASIITGSKLEISCQDNALKEKLSGEWLKLAPLVQIIVENEGDLIQRLKNNKIEKIRFLSTPPVNLQKAVNNTNCRLTIAKVLANGRFELLNYLREITISNNYHRYGNLGIRVNEKRSDVL